MEDRLVKNPEAALCFIPRRCGVCKSTPHFSGFARLACGLFTEAVYWEIGLFLQKRHGLTQ